MVEAEGWRRAIGRLQRLHRAGCQDAQAVEAAVRAVLAGLEGEGEGLRAQRHLHAALLEDEVAERFPPPRASRRHVLKSVLAALDGGGVQEVDDQLYERCVLGLAEGGAAARGDDGAAASPFAGYCCLDVAAAGCIALRVSAGFGGELETGARLWSAGCCLLGLTATGALDALVAGSVLELGAGTGVVGLGLARRGAPVTRVVLTDGQPAVVANLEHNVASSTLLRPLAVPAEARLLEWGSLDLGGLPDFDTIVGSDLVYEESSLPALARLLRRLLRPRGAASAALLASTQRSEGTTAALLAALRAEGLRWEGVLVDEASWARAAWWACLAEDCRSLAEGGRAPRLAREDGEVGAVRLLRITG